MFPNLWQGKDILMYIVIISQTPKNFNIIFKKYLTKRSVCDIIIMLF